MAYAPRGARGLSNTDDKLLPEGLGLLLSLNLARGHVAALVRTIKHLHGGPLQVTLAGCDGGKNDESSTAANVLFYGSGGQTNAYVTEEGKTKVNMFFKSTEMIQLTKVRIKAVSGSRGPRRGLIFVFNDDSKEFKMEEAVEKFAIYDKWADFEYKFSVQVRNAGVGGKPDNPVAYFNFDDDCDEIDVPVSWYPAGQYILVKFLEPRQESAQKLGIVGIKFFGFVKNQVFAEDENKKVFPPNPSKQTSCASPDIVHWLLTFLSDLSLDQGKKKSRMTRQEFLDYSGLELDTLCKLYIDYRNRSDTAETLFQYLCKLIDDPQVDHKGKVYKLAEQLIVDGASLFFPDKESKRQRLFSMMNNVDTFDSEPVLEVMRTLVVVAGQELAMAMSKDEKQPANHAP
nr:hypothetical protein BaRGS_013931 [Batillaria attramentaria]